MAEDISRPIDVENTRNLTNIHVLDAVMGSGKTSATINYMKEHSDKRYIYITPYLDEDTRIATECRELNFVEPNKMYGGEFGSKLRHVRDLIGHGMNIASTHSLFLNFTPDIIELIKNQGYILIIDEAINILAECIGVHKTDLTDLVTLGYITEYNGHYYPADKILDYDGLVWADFFKNFNDKILVENDADDDKSMMIMPIAMMTKNITTRNMRNTRRRSMIPPLITLAI